MSDAKQFGESFVDSKGFTIKVQQSFSSPETVLLLSYKGEQSYSSDIRLTKEQAKQLILSLEKFIENEV